MDRLSAKDRKETLRTEQRAAVRAQPPQSVRFFETLWAAAHQAPLSMAPREREKTISFTPPAFMLLELQTRTLNTDDEEYQVEGLPW